MTEKAGTKQNENARQRESIQGGNPQSDLRQNGSQQGAIGQESSGRSGAQQADSRQNDNRHSESPKAAGTIPVLGVTGGVGAGKSTVLNFLQKRYGAIILEADEIGRQVQQPGGVCYSRMLELFGREALLADGSFDRGRIAAAVFHDRILLRQLNETVHPAVEAQILDEIAREQAKGTAGLIVVEAALFFEAHYEQFCDRVWYIYADEAVRAARLALARGYSEEKARSIMANQMSDAEFRARCDAVIDNSGEPERTFAQVEELCGALQMRARHNLRRPADEGEASICWVLQTRAKHKFSDPRRT